MLINNTKLVMLEGLPGTGKSTKSHFLSMQLNRGSMVARWAHEVARPHPVLFFDEACLSFDEYAAFLRAYPKAEPILSRVAVFRRATIGIDLLELEWTYADDIGTDALKTLREYDVMTFALDKYTAIALEKWAHFTESALTQKDVNIFDSAIFQYQIFTFLLKNASYDTLEAFIQNLLAIVMPLNPSLIYLYRENAYDTLDFLENLRGRKFLERIWERDKDQPYYHDKPTGADGQRHFLLDYADIAKRLFDAACCRKLAIEITDQNWEAQENELLAFLGAERMMPPDSIPPRGIFSNEALGKSMEVRGLLLKDPHGKTRALTPKSDCEFYVEGLPTVLRFDGPDKIVIEGEQICERWTTLGTLFMRIGE